MADAKAHAVAGRAVDGDSDQHVTNITQIVIQSYYNSDHPLESGNRANILNSQWIVSARRIFRSRTDG
jgi:hypothetical protein